MIAKWIRLYFDYCWTRWKTYNLYRLISEWKCICHKFILENDTCASFLKHLIYRYPLFWIEIIHSAEVRSQSTRVMRIVWEFYEFWVFSQWHPTYIFKLNWNCFVYQKLTWIDIYLRQVKIPFKTVSNINCAVSKLLRFFLHHQHQNE